jgi:hypothetical protein
VDDEDFKTLATHKWHAYWNPRTRSFYAMRKIWGKPQRTVYMARAILNATKGQWVDHRNHDTLNNQRFNLRICASSGNCQNSRKRTNNTSGLIGVSWHKGRNKYRAHIQNEGELIHLGLFNDKLEAACVRDMMAKFLHGEFAVLNFPAQ